MSLVGTYVLADDGKFYYEAKLEGDGWLICFDDDDPPELIVEQGTSVQQVKKLLRMLGLRFVVTGKNHGPDTLRCITGDLQRMIHASAYWLEINRPIPVKLITKFERCDDEPQGQACIYYFGE